MRWKLSKKAGIIFPIDMSLWNIQRGYEELMRLIERAVVLIRLLQERNVTKTKDYFC